MQLISVTGCLCDSLTVDGVEEIDLPNDEARKEIVDKIGDYISSLKEENYDTYTRENLACNIEGYLNYEEDSLLDKSFKELGEIVKSAPGDQLNYILQFVIPNLGSITYHSEEPCECCGDYVWEYTLEIQD